MTESLRGEKPEFFIWKARNWPLYFLYLVAMGSSARDH
jgi:hypothetical protein